MLVVGVAVVELLDLDAQAAVGQRLGGAGDAAVQARSATARAPPGRRTRSATSATVPTVGELLLVPGHEQDALLLADIHGERERHARKDDGVVERDQK